MKILLSSNGSFFYENFYDIFNIHIKDVKLAFITTASKGVSNKEYMEKHILKMKELGFDFTEIDIDYKNEEELETSLKDFNFIYVAGGSSFYLLKSIKKSGFDKVVKKLVTQGVVYIGSSAGAYVASPSIDISVWKDEYRKEKRNRYGLVDFNAMGLVDFLVLAHYEEGLKEIIKKNLLNSKYLLRILRDGQALLIDDDKISFIGEGEEEIIN